MHEFRSNAITLKWLGVLASWHDHVSETTSHSQYLFGDRFAALGEDSFKKTKTRMGISCESREDEGVKGIVSRHSGKAANLRGLDPADLRCGQTFANAAHRRIQTTPAIRERRRRLGAYSLKTRQLAHPGKRPSRRITWRLARDLGNTIPPQASVSGNLFKDVGDNAVLLVVWTMWKMQQDICPREVFTLPTSFLRNVRIAPRYGKFINNVECVVLRGKGHFPWNTRFSDREIASSQYNFVKWDKRLRLKIIASKNKFY